MVGQSDGGGDGGREQYTGPRANPLIKWGLGVVAPVALAGYGLRGMILLNLVLPSRYGRMELEGVSAILGGLALLSLAASVNLHFFWDNVWQDHPINYWGKRVGVALAAVLYLLAVFLPMT